MSGLSVAIRKPHDLQKIVKSAIYDRMIPRRMYLREKIRYLWEDQRTVALALEGQDQAKGLRLYRCRPWGAWVMLNEQKMPYICEHSICPNCLARNIERVYNTVKSLPNCDGMTRLWTHTTIVGNNARQQMTAFRDYMAYKLGKIYKLSAVTFVRLLRIKQKWIIALNALVPHRLHDAEEIVLSPDPNMTTSADYRDSADEALVDFLPRIMGFQKTLFDPAQITAMLWYLEETKRLHMVRGLRGITLT
jgi:hypothetical protein